jgi:hypothetical protein
MFEKFRTWLNNVFLVLEEHTGNLLSKSDGWAHRKVADEFINDNPKEEIHLT